MFIVNWKRNQIVNMDKVLSIEINEKSIVYKETANERYVILGSYKDEERMLEVWKEMLDSLFPQKIICMQNIEITDEKVKEMLKDNAFCVVTPDKQPKVDFIAPTVFYMPKE